ncbi:hypothetical protein BAUCODRAFT_120997 [Baudoinia panamericana UAMH 10762]|uniref:Urease accessory protein UreD n=1 Tax=Baudoinia panamericana (strain UAMH 10762) TaxID=717646 RepID=M2N2E8_BAUPA|nr:uncharacterized protein BAUCODRAFT_120997 [Baudoinia panamericana UAMH 10762]EMC98093.1 hypothetical protein BAUCODRAFT_120997 [Baudoinia panamericana UAMH 10762]
MPHKHTRKRKAESDTDFNLAPNSVAKPLPAFSSELRQPRKPDEPKRQTLKRKRPGSSDYKHDDTPRAFARMMQWQNGVKHASDLDDGKGKKKRKLGEKPTVATTSEPAPEKLELPKILPGERLADYNARVDQALPVGGLARKGKGPKIDGLKERQTRTEKRLHKMYAAWREEDVRLKEKKEEQLEAEEEAEDERRALYGEDYNTSELRKGKRRKVMGENTEVKDEDPWAILKERRERPRGLHDVVQAPPNLKVVPKEKFKVRNNAKVDVTNVPSAAGSLKRREELSEARRDVIARYRAMMKGESGL